MKRQLYTSFAVIVRFMLDTLKETRVLRIIFGVRGEKKTILVVVMGGIGQCITVYCKCMYYSFCMKHNALEANIPFDCRCEEDYFLRIKVSFPSGNNVNNSTCLALGSNWKKKVPTNYFYKKRCENTRKNYVWLLPTLG